MTRSVWVYGPRAYTDKDVFAKQGVAPLFPAEEVPAYGLPPRYVYQVDYPGLHRLTTEQTEVHRLTRGHPEATVRIIPVVH